MKQRTPYPLNAGALERFISRVLFSPAGSAGCWLWKGANEHDGYGSFNLIEWDVPRRAHIVGFEWFVGPVPNGLQLDHLCRVRACVNPDHLEAVPQRVNILRGESPSARHAIATSCPKGHPYDEANTYRKKGGGRDCRACHREQVKAAKDAARGDRPKRKPPLADQQVTELRERHAQGERLPSLASKFGIHPSQASRIVRGLRSSRDRVPVDAAQCGRREAWARQAEVTL